MSEIKLLPCPFCGGEAKTGYAINDYNRWGVICTNCEACVEVAEWKGVADTEENAIRAWNTRKPMQEICERLEELFKYNSEQADIYIDGEGAYMREKKEMYMDRANCYGVAIRTVKEVGGMND